MSESAPGFAKHPDYQVDIASPSNHVRALVGEVVIADTQRALLVQESRHHPVWYLPLADVNTELLRATDHSTFCPFKGHASYWSIRAGGETLDNVVWAYQDPYLECAPLKDHVAFYTDRVALEIDGEKQQAQAPGWTS
jgi:uncharacterized protein (DUF427 family)